MKIAFVVDDSLDSSDGVQQYVLTVGTWLKNNGHEIHYITSQTQRDIPNLHVVGKNIRVGFNKNRLGVPLLASKQKIKTILDKHQFDVVHVQMPFSPLLSSRVIKQLHSHTALVGTFHIAPFSRINVLGAKILHTMTRMIQQRFDEVLSVSSVAQDFARTTFSMDSHVIPNAVDIKRFVSTISPKPRKIVFLGRLVKRKGCLELLHVAHELHKNSVSFEGLYSLLISF